jgi:hypothetical protein
MSTSSVEKSESILSKRRLSIAGAAALLGCAACCAAPLLLAAGIGSSVIGALTAVFRPGAELLVGGTAFTATLAVMALGKRLRRARGGERGASCNGDASCCDGSRSTTRV